MHREQNAAYFHARQACYLCLNPHDVVDTDIQIEGEGSLAICKSCIADLARTAGFELDNREERESREQLLVDTIHTLEEQLAEDDKIVTAVHNAGERAVARQMERVRSAKGN